MSPVKNMSNVMGQFFTKEQILKKLRQYFYDLDVNASRKKCDNLCSVIFFTGNMKMKRIQ